jgi:hypothetical protein
MKLYGSYDTWREHDQIEVGDNLFGNVLSCRMFNADTKKATYRDQVIFMKA